MIAFSPASASELVARFPLASSDLVVEVGSGDGRFLRSLREFGPRVLGVDPERRCVVEAFCRGIDTVWGEFATSIAATIRQRYGLARLVIFRSATTPEMLAAAHECLTDDGILLVGHAANRPLAFPRAA
jgi:hypothetical protein